MEEDNPFLDTDNAVSVSSARQPRSRSRSRGRQEALDVLADMASRRSVCRALIKLGNMLAKEQREADRFSDLLRKEEEKNRDLMRRNRAAQADLHDKTVELDAANAANEAKEASLAQARGELAKRNRPAAASLKIVRGACLRLAAHRGGCAVCQQPLTEADTVLTGPCLHPSHRRCGEKWRHTRRQQADQAETCPGCAAVVNAWEWYTVPRARGAAGAPPQPAS